MIRGQGLVEYALVVALVAVVAIVALLWFGREVGQIINEIGSRLCSSSHLCVAR